MAFVSVGNKGYELSGGYQYKGITDNSLDWESVPNNSYFFDKELKQVFYKDANGGIYGAYYGGTLSTNNYSTSSTQWITSLRLPISLETGKIANGFTFFNNELDKSLEGTTSYNDFNISFGRSIYLSGNTSSANINVNEEDYLATFDTDLFTTASNWVNDNKETLNALGIQVFALGEGEDGRIRFGALSDVILNAITITPTTIIEGNLNGEIANEFTGNENAVGDHVVVPYVDTKYMGARIFHFIRANFNIVTGSIQYAELGLFRWENDTLIGSLSQIVRNADTTGNQVNFITYTANSDDPFVTGGFYIALLNNTGHTLEFTSNAGILIENIFDKAYSF